MYIYVFIIKPILQFGHGPFGLRKQNNIELQELSLIEESFISGEHKIMMIHPNDF